MILGRFHDGFPRVALALPTLNATDEANVEFIVDTGFDGYLTLPADLVRHLAVQPFGPQTQMLADGTQIECPVCYITLLWDNEPREVEVLILGRTPLLGTLFLQNCHLDIDLSEGGDVIIEPQ